MAQLRSQLLAAEWRVSLFLLDVEYEDYELTGHAKALGTCFEWEDLASDDPSNRSPRASEEEDVDAHECDSGALSWQISGTRNSTSDRDDV